MFEERKYAFINSSDTGSIDYSEILETSVSTLRSSVDGTLTLIRWESESVPSFISPSGSVVPTWQGTNSECLTQLTSS